MIALLLQLLACLETAEVRLDLRGRIACQLLLLAHQIATNAGLDFGRTLIQLPIGAPLARHADAAAVAAVQRRDGGRRRRRHGQRYAGVLDLLAHAIAAKVGLDLGGGVLLRYGRVGRTRMDVHDE